MRSSTFLAVRQLRNGVCVLSHLNSLMLTTTITFHVEFGFGKKIVNDVLDALRDFTSLV